MGSFPEAIPAHAYGNYVEHIAVAAERVAECGGMLPKDQISRYTNVVSSGIKKWTMLCQNRLPPSPEILFSAVGTNSNRQINLYSYSLGYPAVAATVNSHTAPFTR